MTVWLAAAAVAVWTVLLLDRGGWWRIRERLPEAAVATGPAVVAVVPARNEAATIVPAVRSLLAQDYPNALTVVVVDDQSTDGTGGLARALVAGLPADRRLVVIDGRPLPDGWSGKVWAQVAGLGRADDVAPAAPWVWFTDADIVHASDVLGRLVRQAQLSKAALVSVMVDLRVQSAAERWLVPAFVHFFRLLYPFRWVGEARRPTAAAAGGSMLVARSALHAIGGLGVIRDRLIDDVALGRAVKAAGGSLWLGLSHDSRSLRGYDLGAFWNMVRRSAFTELGCSYARLAVYVAGLGLVFVLPPLLLTMPGAARWLGAAALVMMAATYLPLLRWYGASPLWALALPLTAMAYLGMTVHSAADHARGRVARWHGRVYDT